MGFNKYFVPEPKQMIKVLEDGVSDFFNRKIDALVGNSVSMQMIDDAYGLLKMKVDEDEIIETLKTKYKYELTKENSSV
jgi:hypothetical protein